MQYSDIENLTNAEAVAYYGSLTVLPIDAGDLENLLGWSGKAKRNAITGAWEGSLIDFMDDPLTGAEAIGEGLEELFSHLNKPRSTGCDTHEQPWASKMSDLLGGLQMVGLVDAKFVADVAALGGGYVYEDLTEGDVQKLRDDYDALQLVIAENAARAEQERIDSELLSTRHRQYNEKFNEFVSPVLSDPQSTGADIKSALEAMAASYGA